MVKIKGSKCFPVAAALVGVLWVSACAANQSSEAASAAAPGSFRSIMATKMPGVYGPHLAAADAAPTQVAASTCQPGSFAAVMSVKLPPNARPGNPEIYKDCR